MDKNVPRLAVDLYRPLIFKSAELGQVARLELFTKQWARADFQECVGPDKDGRNSAFVWAARNGKERLVRYMVEKGVDPNMSAEVDFDGEQIADAPALWAASAAGHLGVVKYLVQAGADIDAATGSCSTPLRGACFDGHLEIVEFLVEHGADIEKANKHGHTPLMIAAFRRQLAVVRYLLSKSADVKKKTVRGNTALHDAAEIGDQKITQLLVEAGAENVADEYGTTPLMCAAYLGRQQLFSLLMPLASRREHRDCYKLLGAYHLDRTHDTAEAVECWRKSISIDQELRSEGIYDTFDLPETSKNVYGGAVEVRTHEELLAIVNDSERLNTQALLMRERILGGHHSETIYVLRFRGALYCDMGQFGQCMDVWLHALNLQQYHLCPAHPGIVATLVTFLDTFLYATNERIISGHHTGTPKKDHLLKHVMIVLDRIVFEFERYVRKEKKIDYEDVFVDGAKTLKQDLIQLLTVSLHLFNLLFRLENAHTLQKEIKKAFAEHTMCTGGTNCCSRYNLQFSEENVDSSSMEAQNLCGGYNDPEICISLNNLVRSLTKIASTLGINLLHLLFGRSVTRADEVQFPCLTLLNTMLEAGVCPNKPNENGDTALHLLLHKHPLRLTLARSLIAHGALIHARNNRDRTCFELIKEFRLGAKLGYPMSLAGLAANTMRRKGIPYKGKIPRALERLADLH
uniref:ANK_REP_REGION domain-containing protein n=1 Tax=Steinernema glaseri TaxID=37863 RepID=A0A1I7YHH8_9BILA